MIYNSNDFSTQIVFDDNPTGKNAQWDFEKLDLATRPSLISDSFELVEISDGSVLEILYSHYSRGLVELVRPNEYQETAYEQLYWNYSRGLLLSES